LLDGLKFDDYGILDQEIEAESGIESQAVIDDWKTDLPAKLNSSFRQLVAHACLVYRFKKPRPKRRMHLEGRINDLGCNPLSCRRQRNW
jgi:hypothetical protein